VLEKPFELSALEELVEKGAKLVILRERSDRRT
jgi:hypothetical protein